MNLKETKTLAQEIEESEEQVDQPLSADPGEDVIDDQFAKQPFRVVYQTNNFLLPQIAALIEDGEDITLRPEYQRRLRWTNKQKSLLIESLLLNIPIPPVFLYENDLARYEVMDGQQRLNAIREFLSNQFSLRGLQIISSLNGKPYARLPPKVKRSLDRASISAVVLLQESQGKIKSATGNRFYELRRFVFERLNTGGRRLTAQEIRNAIYGGEFNKLIVQLSRDSTFTRIWGIPPYVGANPNDYYEDEARQGNSLYKTMGDCQLVLRFFALENEVQIQGSLKAMLDRCMERNINTSVEDCRVLGERYLGVLRLADSLFDGMPFSFRTSEEEYRPLAGIYDGVMVALSEIIQHEERLIANKSAVQQKYAQLVNSTSHRGALTGVASTSADIKGRIDIFRNLFAEFI
ncbi:MAG: DUF262 domain-containing protein [Candidatus Delongbacteria bacterium]